MLFVSDPSSLGAGSRRESSRRGLALQAIWRPAVIPWTCDTSCRERAEPFDANEASACDTLVGYQRMEGP